MRFLIGSIFALGIIVAAAVIIFTNGSNGEPEALAPTATTAVTATATPAYIDSEGTVPAPTPTPGPQIEPHTALFDLAKSTHLALSEPGERADRVAFSPDGRWMVFYDSKGPIEAPSFNIYRIDLGAPALDADLLYEGGFFFGSPDFSSTGDFAFIAIDEERTRWPAVMKPDGSIHRLSRPGHVTSWSPDGRWLTYEEFFSDDADLAAQYLVDTETWEERQIGESAPCNCDANPRPVWAPDSAKFIYSYLVGEIPNSYSVSEVHSLDGRPPVQIEDSYQWFGPERYITRVYDEPAATYDIVAVNLETGARTALFQDNPRDQSLWMSPTEPLFFTEGTLLNSDGDVVASMPGGFRRWSPDGQHILTFSNGTSCGRGYRLQATDGELIGCGPYPQEGSPFDYDLQNDAFAYVVPTRPGIEFAVNAYVMDIASGELALVAENFVAASTCIALSPDSRFLVLGHACGV